MLYVGAEFSGLSANSSGGTNKQHEQSLIAMGFLPEKELDEIPKGMEYLFSTYKEIRFSITDKNKLSPRKELSYETLNAYKSAMQFGLSPTECSIILSIDAIFNTSTQ